LRVLFQGGIKVVSIALDARPVRAFPRPKLQRLIVVVGTVSLGNWLRLDGTADNRVPKQIQDFRTSTQKVETLGESRAGKAYQK
jgi:hypothetical protein